MGESVSWPIFHYVLRGNELQVNNVHRIGRMQKINNFLIILDMYHTGATIY